MHSRTMTWKNVITSVLNSTGSIRMGRREEACKQTHRGPVGRQSSSGWIAGAAGQQAAGEGVEEGVRGFQALLQ